MSNKDKIVHGYISQARDAALVGDRVSPRVFSPSIDSRVMERLLKSSLSNVRTNETPKFDLVHRKASLDIARKLMSGNVDDDEIEVMWLNYFWEFAKQTKTETRHEYDYYSASERHRCQQALYLYHLGFYKRLIYTEPVSLMDANGNPIEYSKDRIFTERQVVSYLKEREFEAAYGSRKRIVKDNWVAYDGKLGGIDQHKSLSNKSKYQNARTEGPIVIIAMWLILGKEGQRSQISLMRGAQVFECYKYIRNLLKTKCNLGRREPLDAAGVFGIVRDSQLCLISNYECHVCKVPFYDVADVPECPRGCCNSKILRPI